MKQPIRLVPVVALLLLAGCATTHWGTEMSGGCYTDQYGLHENPWFDQNVKKIEWTGKCNDSDSADGPGVMTITLKDGRKVRYEGTMSSGSTSGEGKLTLADGTAYAGYISKSGSFATKSYAPDGRLVFEGSFGEMGADPTAPLTYSSGILHEPNGGTVEGEFDGKSIPVDRNGPGIVNVVVKEKGGSFAYGQIGSSRYTSVAQYNAALTAFNAARAAQAAADAAQAEADRLVRQAQYEQDQADRAAADAQSQQIANAILGAVGTYYGAQAAADNSAAQAQAQQQIAAAQQAAEAARQRQYAAQQAYAQQQQAYVPPPAPGRPAMDCVELVTFASRDSSATMNRKFINHCSDRVEVAWWYEGDRSGNNWTIGSGADYPVSANGAIHWGACHGRNTISQLTPPSYNFNCSAELQ